MDDPLYYLYVGSVDSIWICGFYVGSMDSMLDLWILCWICGFYVGSVDSMLDLWILCWICGFYVGSVDSMLDLWILCWIYGFYVGSVDSMLDLWILFGSVDSMLDLWILFGSVDSMLDLWILCWIYGFYVGSVDSIWICGFYVGSMNSMLDLWTLCWIYGFYVGSMDSMLEILCWIYGYGGRNSITIKEVSRIQCLSANLNWLVWKGIYPATKNSLQYQWVDNWLMANFPLSGRVRSRKVLPEVWLSTLGQFSVWENIIFKIKDDYNDLWSDFESLNLRLLFRTVEHHHHDHLWKSS